MKATANKLKLNGNVDACTREKWTMKGQERQRKQKYAHTHTLTFIHKKETKRPIFGTQHRTIEIQQGTKWCVNINLKFHQYIQSVSFWLRLRGMHQNKRKACQTVWQIRNFLFSSCFAFHCLVLCLSWSRSTFLSLYTCKICCMKMMIW